MKPLAIFVALVAIPAFASAQNDQTRPNRDRQGQGTRVFNGRDLTGWKTKADSGPADKWRVGRPALDTANPAKFTIEEGGRALINDITEHGTSRDIVSEAVFGDCVIRLDVMLPKESNSGIYVMGEYEIQVFDSIGKEANPAPNDMGALYGAQPPKNPKYLAPGEWNTYEIHFQAPKFDKDGNKTANAKFLKVILNGATIHENVEMKGPTPGGVDGKEKAEGPLMFQGNHGPVAYRSIRVAPLPKAG